MKKLFTEIFKSLFRSKPTAPAIPSTLADNRAYPAACLRAASDQQAFDHFRQDPAYTYVLEHVAGEIGQIYLNMVSSDRAIMDMIEEFRLNDRYGNPVTFDYPPAGRFSPTTLRYMKVLSDIKAGFKSLDKLRICEIGVGYGGQCRVLDAFYKTAGYRLVDIAPALALAKRYLGGFAMHTSPDFKTMEELDDTSYDMVISNYAFTELTRSIQTEYLQKIILRSKMGYITYNEIMPPEFKSHKVPELLEMIPGARVVAEEPLTHPKNCIILWGDNAAA